MRLMALSLALARAWGSYSYFYSSAEESSSGADADAVGCDLGNGRFGWRCGDNSCLPETRRCDGRPDCADGSDEMNCSFECWLSDSPLKGYQCGDGSCVSGKQQCDGTANCADGSDELGCLSECVLPKGGRGVLCSGASGMCLQPSRVCDGEAQCPDGSDEMGCGFQCETPDGVPGWLCSNGTCLGASHLCDGEPQMLDGMMAHRVSLPTSSPPWLARQRAKHERPHARHTKPPPPMLFLQPPQPNPAPPLPAQQVTIHGVALADGYLSDCWIFLDTDGSGVLDASRQPYTTTASRSRHGLGEMAGQWTLTFDASLLTAWPRPVLRLLRPSYWDTSCIDLATNLPPGVDLAAPLPNYVGTTSVVISPLSSLFTALRDLTSPDNSVSTRAQQEGAIAGADYEAARSLAWGLGLPPFDEPRTLLSFDPLLERGLQQDPFRAVVLAASSHTLRAVEILHAAFPLDEPATTRYMTAWYLTGGGFSALAHRLRDLSSYRGDQPYLSRPGQVAAAFQFSSWDSLSNLVHIVVDLLLESGVKEKADGSWELAEIDVTALIPVTSAAIEEALSVEASDAPRLLRELSAIAIATRLHLISCLAEHWQAGPSCRQTYDRAAFAAAVDAILGGSQRASIGCAGGCGPEGWDEHGYEVIPLVEVVGQVKGPSIGAFIVCAFVLVIAFVLAARRDVLPPMLAKRMPPILGPSRHDARGVWVPMDSPLYAHIQTYSTDSPPSSMEGSSDGRRPTRAAATEPLARQLRSERRPPARFVDPTAPLTLQPAVGKPLSTTGEDDEEEEIPIAPPGFRG